MKTTSCLFIIATSFLFVFCSVGAIAQQTVKIKNQVWTKSNLNVDHFKNGDKIAQAKTPEEWDLYFKSGTPAWCYYDNDPSTDAKYGKFYNWFAVSDPRGLAPKGWHIPTQQEWETLIENLGGEKKAGKAMKAQTGWLKDEASQKDGNGTNSSNFCGVAAGYCEDDGVTEAAGEEAIFWSSTPIDKETVWCVWLDSETDGVDAGEDDNTIGMSVRCVKD